MNIFSFGIIADIGDLRNKYFTHFGHLGYILSTLINLIKVKAHTYHYQIDSDTTQQHPATFITFCNSRYTGGNMLIAPHANTHDSLIDIIKMQPCKRLSILKSFPKIFTGEHIKLPFIDKSQAQQINFDFMNPVNTLIDGEIINIKPETLTVLPNEISIIV